MKRLMPYLSLAVFMAACASSPVPDEGGADADLPTPQAIAGVENFAKVTDGVWRGAQPTAEGMATLKAMGVKTIISLRSIHGDTDLMRGTGLSYVEIHSTPLTLTDEDIAMALKVATTSAQRPVFIHCQHGADRTGAVIAAYRVVVQGWDMRKARREVSRFGFHEVWKNIEWNLDHLDADKIAALMGKVEVGIDLVP